MPAVGPISSAQQVNKKNDCHLFGLGVRLRSADDDRLRTSRSTSGLKLAPQLSFDDDSRLERDPRRGASPEGSIASGEASVIFFGTSNCSNTSREAERLVRLYPRFRNRIYFLIVDSQPRGARSEQALVSQYYHGYIPTITAIDSKGHVIYDRAGETASTHGDTSNLQRLLDSVH